MRTPVPKRELLLTGNVLLCLGIAASLAGCVDPLPFCPQNLSELHVKGVHHIQLPAPCSIDFRNHCPGSVVNILPLPPTADLAKEKGPGEIVQQDAEFFYVNESDTWTNLNLSDACAGTLSLSTDGQQLACVQGTEGCIDCFTESSTEFGKSIDLVSLARETFGQHESIVPRLSGISYGVLSWSPDGQHVVALQRELSKEISTCSLGLFTAPSQSGSYFRSADIPLDVPGACESSQILWSPDGKYITLLAAYYGALPHKVYLLDAFSVLTAIQLSPAVTITLKPSLVDLLTLPVSSRSPYSARPFVAWMPNSHVLTITESDGYDAVQIDPTTKAQHLLLAIPKQESPIQIFAWSSDGMRVYFSIGHGGDTCSAPPAALYVYSPRPFDTLPLFVPTPTISVPSPTSAR